MTKLFLILLSIEHKFIRKFFAESVDVCQKDTVFCLILVDFKTENVMDLQRLFLHE
jgi:hypothetical protein